MFRILLSLTGRLLPLLLFLGLSACSPAQPMAPVNSGAIEQTTNEPAPLDQLELPILQRRRLFAELGVDRWHQQGLRGQRIKIAILDSGFRGYRKFLGKGLPPTVTTRSFRRDRDLEARDSQHGILCGEVLHSLAPDAEMLLANWEPDSPQAFLDAIRWAKGAGAKIVSCSLIMPSWSDGEGGGEVHRALDDLLERGDLLFFASAGNTAQRHWCGTFDPDGAGWHRWNEDASANPLRPWGAERVAVELYGPMRTALEVSVWDSQSGQLIGQADLYHDSTKQCGRAVVRFEPTPDVAYAVRVRCRQPKDDRKAEAFHLAVLGGSLEHAVRHGSIPFPGDGAAVIAVGAVDADGARLTYSSCGPNSRVPKPDFVATVPFPSLCRAQPFAGTSAAAPQAAGLATLLWSRHPDWSGRRVLDALRSASLDLGPAGHDWETGFGLIRLPR